MSKDCTHIPDEKLEKFLLSALFLKPDKIVEIVDNFESKFFKYDKHKHIYDAIYSLYEKKLPVEADTVWLVICQKNLQSDMLLESDVKYISEGSNYVISASGAVVWALELTRRHAERELTKRLTNDLAKIQAKSLTLEQMKEMAINVGTVVGNITSNGVEIAKISFEANAIVAKMQNKLNKKSITGHTTGVAELDNLIDGIQKKRVTTIVGDSSSGKTQLGSIQIAVENALLGKSVFIGSFEMPKNELFERMAFYLTGLSTTAINNPKKFINFGINTGKFNNQQEGIEYVSAKMKEAEVILNALPIYIYENDEANMDDFKNAIYKQVLQVGTPDLIICDHAELLVQDRKDLITELYKIYRKAKDIAKKINSAFVMLHQYSNEMKNSKDKYPEVYAIMGGSAVRHNSDAILMIYNPSIYQNLIKENPDLKDVFDIVIGKARYFDKGNGVVNCKFNGSKVLDKVTAHASE